MLTPGLTLKPVSRFKRTGHLAEAIEDYDEAIRLDPQFASAYVNRGIAYRRLGQPVSLAGETGKRR